MGEYIAQEPLWLQAWIYWLGIANVASVLFVWKSVEARWAAAAFVGVILFGGWLFDQVGYVRLMGLPHVVFWTPLLVYLYRRRATIDPKTVTGAYLYVLFATDGISLVIDYIDVVRYLLGDGALT